MNRKFISFALYAIVSFLLFGQTLRYGFVYDDHMRVERNPAIQSLSRLDRFFWDRSTQSETPALQRDNYRPLVTLNFALDYKLWNPQPGFYRLENLLLHAANAALVCGLAEAFLGLSAGAAFFSGLLFLVHPAQTESVIWISDRSNLLATFFLLLGMISWRRFQNGGQRRWWSASSASFVLGLLSRETAVCFPLIVILMDWSQPKIFKKKESRPKFRWGTYAVWGGTSLSYIAVRRLVLGQTEQAALWGGTLWSNLANVFQCWPIYLRTLAWPLNLRATYSDLPIAASLFEPGPLLGLFIFSSLLALSIYFHRRLPRLSFCGIVFFILWLPGSNLIPLRTLFAERLLYPLLIPVALGFGLLLNGLKLKWPSLMDSRSLPLPIFLAGFFLILSALSDAQASVWETDYTLWLHATQAAPESWFGWYSRGLAELSNALRLKSRHLTSNSWFPAAEASFIQALKKKPPIESGGEIFFLLAETERNQGKLALAKEHGKRALILRPDLKSAVSGSTRF